MQKAERDRVVVALEFDVPLATIAEHAARLRPAPHRGEVVRLANGITVIDDSYNANPAATRRALEVLERVHASRRLAVLGEMLELGEHATALHRGSGHVAAGSGLSLLVAVGGAPARELANAAMAAGMPATHVRYVETSDAAAALAVDALRTGDLVLVKGSRGTRTDIVADRIVEAFG